MESISKSRIQGVWDPAHSTRTGIIAHSTRVGIPSGCRHFPPGCITSGIQEPDGRGGHFNFSGYTYLDPLITLTQIRLPPPFHPAAATFHPDVSHPEIYCRRHYIRMSYIRNSGAGWERKAFQLLRIYIFESSNSAHPESFAANFAQCRGVLLKLPDICDRHLEIFCFRYLMSKYPKSPCNPPIIGFLSL